MITTISGPEKARLATAAGAHHVINYREGDPAAEIREIAPDGVDIVAEVALGANLALDLAVLRTRGTISTYGNDGGKPVELDVMRNMVLNTRFQFVVLYTVGSSRSPRRLRTSPPRSATARCRSARSTACRWSASRSTGPPTRTARWRAARSARSSWTSHRDARSARAFGGQRLRPGPSRVRGW
ncbi:zinc-binding dehydrogenase [Streptomyces indonesiensis]